MLDIDHFKRINDTFGHQAGDVVLQQLVQFLREMVRSGDLLFRWGGEEFVILTFSTGHRNARLFAESLRRKIAAHAFPDVGRLTVSIGVAEYLSSESAAEWFHRADEALYRAKQSGRNRVVVDSRGNSDAWGASDLSVLHLAWQEAYECGDATIDGQHRQLFDLANVLIEASLEQQKKPQVVHAALENLLSHVARHFADEEALLERHEYARLLPHKAAHARLLEKAAMLEQAARSGNVSLGELVNFIVGDVVAHHLFTMDRDFYPLFAQRAENAAGR
jgi:diguanylate cyclase (GGDEF)-like protein/hemerythrin-like metal-binding protein